MHFWPTALSFSTAWIPSLDQLRGYQELNTPLAFIVFGALERLFHGGIAAGRFLNLLLSFGLVSAVVLAEQRYTAVGAGSRRTSALPSVAVSTHLYTDVIATAFVLLGLISHLNQKPLVSAVCWALAIATRSCTPSPFRWQSRPGLLASSSRVRQRVRGALAHAAAGAATLGLWFWFFGGQAPMAELVRQEVGANRLQNLHPSHAVYLLVCVGVFYVIPEFVLFQDARPPSLKLRRASLVRVAIAAATVLAALFFAPLGNHWGPMTMGLFNQVSVALLDPIPRALLYGGLAALATLRFSERSPAAFLVAANAGVLVLSYTMWEKYAFPLLVCLWFLRVRLVESTRPLKES